MEVAKEVTKAITEIESICEEIAANVALLDVDGVSKMNVLLNRAKEYRKHFAKHKEWVGEKSFNREPPRGTPPTPSDMMKSDK